MYFNIIIQSSTIKRNRYIEKNRINVSEPDVQKTSTEKSSNFKICYNHINFRSRRSFEKICCINIEEAKGEIYLNGYSVILLMTGNLIPQIRY